MLRHLQIVLLSLMAIYPAIAADARPSADSVKQLLDLMDAKKLIGLAGQQTDAAMQAEFQKTLAGRPITPDEQKIVDEMRAKAVAIIQEGLTWGAVEPMLTALYQDSFTQEEIDGLSSFYRSEAGRAFVAKMPIVQQKSIQLFQSILGPMNTKLQQLQADTLAQLKTLHEKR